MAFFQFVASVTGILLASVLDILYLSRTFAGIIEHDYNEALVSLIALLILILVESLIGIAVCSAIQHAC